MDRTPSQLYRTVHENAADLLKHSLEKGLQANTTQTPVPVFFRADDIGVLSDSFADMLKSFSFFHVPLCLAVVPAWLTQARWSAMADVCDRSSPLWCWHQHGWKHLNHETCGKKCEFGPSRLSADIAHDLTRGKKRLQEILGPQFSPYFTPPWNRCSLETITMLKNSGFKALSRSRGAEPDSTPLLPDFPINVDLHTRKEQDGAASLAALATELEHAARAGSIGVMIHHQRMNHRAFKLMHDLLQIISHHDRLQPLLFSDLLP